MAQTYTDRLDLAKDDGDESVLSWRGHNNSNLDIIDDFAEDISDSIANFETSPATSNHAAGTYFMLENTLHRAKSAIASGESITSSNAEPITIAQVLNTLNGNVSALQDSVSGAYTGDLNDLKTYCLRYCTVTSTNRPLTAGGFLLVWQSYSGYVAQLFIANTNTNPQTFVRICNNGPWGNWCEVSVAWNANAAKINNLAMEYVTDMNTPSNVVRFGLYGSNTPGKPTTDSWGAFIQIGGCQIAFGGNAGKVYTRRYADNTWGNWKSVALS